jgi:hypothetical protein
VLAQARDRLFAEREDASSVSQETLAGRAQLICMLIADCVRFSAAAARVNDLWSATATKAVNSSGSRVGSRIMIRDASYQKNSIL